MLRWAWDPGNSGLRVHGHSIVRAWGGGPCWWASSGLPVLPTHLPQGCLPPKAALTERPQPPPCIYSWGSGLAGTECVHKDLGIPEPPHAFQGLRFGCFVWSEPGRWAQRALNSIVGGGTCEHAGGQQVPETKDGDSADKRETLGPLLALPVTAKVTGRKGHTCLKTAVWVLPRFSKYFSCWSWLPGDLGAHSA